MQPEGKPRGEGRGAPEPALLPAYKNTRSRTARLSLYLTRAEVDVAAHHVLGHDRVALFPRDGDGARAGPDPGAVELNLPVAIAVGRGGEVPDAPASGWKVRD